MIKTNGPELLLKRIDDEERGGIFIDWVLEQKLYLKGVPFSFEGHEYLRQIYEDMHPDMRIRKGVQVCISTFAILKLFWRSAKFGKKGIYYLPTREFVKDFTPDRIDPILRQIPEISERLIIDHVFLKQFSGTSVSIWGMNTRSEVSSKDNDTMVADEFDLSNVELREEAKDRLMHSSSPWKIFLSKPTIPGFGIDAEFQESDQHFYLFICPACHHYNNVVEYWPANMFQVKGTDKYYLGCTKCQAKLDPTQAEWVPKYPSRNKIRGYHISQLYWSWQPEGFASAADMLFDLYRKADTITKRKRVWQSGLGLPFSGEMQPITDAVLDQCHGSHGFFHCYPHSFLGFDQGDTLYYVVGHIEEDIMVIHLVGKCTAFGKLDLLMVDHNVWCAVGDAMPNKHPAKEWALRHKGFAYIQYFHEGDMKIGKETKDDDEVQKVVVDRTEGLDELCEDILKVKFLFPVRNCDEIMEEFRTHLKNLVKEKKQTPRGEKIEYKHDIENHFAMALLNFRIATRLPVVMPYGLPLIPGHGDFRNAN
jgi:hypothetical protein